jgi:hypothetical protein
MNRLSLLLVATLLVAPTSVLHAEDAPPPPPRAARAEPEEAAR